MKLSPFWYLLLNLFVLNILMNSSVDPPANSNEY
jgi:hypothetical protein